MTTMAGEWSLKLRLLVGAAVALVTGSVASAGQGLAANTVTITADGISPRSLVIKAANVRFRPIWTNLDAVAHAVRFDNGRCVVELAPGERKWCEGSGAGFSYYVGTYRYRVSDLVDPAGEVVVVPHKRRVTMFASRTTTRSGQAVVLFGSVSATPLGPFGGTTPTPTVTLLRRLAGSQRFLPIRQERSRECLASYPSCELNEAIWSTTIRPRATATYLARIVDPPEGTVWKRADSRRIVVRVTPSPG